METCDHEIYVSNYSRRCERLKDHDGSHITCYHTINTDFRAVVATLTWDTPERRRLDEVGYG